MKGNVLLKNGIMWRVGNGELINIWDDLWLSHGTTHMVSSLCGQTLIQQVCELINPVINQWDEDLVKSILNEEDVGVTSAISLLEDILAILGWHFDSKRSF